VPVLHPRVLKRPKVATNPEVQQSVDRLVGMGIVLISDVIYTIDSDGVSFQARYQLNRDLAVPIIDAVQRREQGRRETSFIRELSLALLGLGTEMLWRATEVDAAYGDPNADVGSVIDLAPLTHERSRAVSSADVLRELAEGATLSPSEVVNLYVRHLYALLSDTIS
jgi:hypothetical protein